MKSIFISTRIKKESSNGAYIVAKRNLDHLCTILGDENVIVKEIHSKLSPIRRIYNVITQNRMECIDITQEKEIIRQIKEEKIEYVFIDTSVYGILCSKIKKKFPNIKIVTFWHDVDFERMINLASEKKDKFIMTFINRFKYKIYANGAKKNEKLTCKYSDIIICLNDRDAKLISLHYKKKVNYIIPVTFKENSKDLKELYNSKDNDLGRYKFLFVGVATYRPNIQGLEFFIKGVLPYIDINLEVVGKGMERYREYLEKINDKVKVIGTVENIESYYLNADAVIAPIYLGGGMKVKTAEALMYGKNIFGTREAFEGYELDYEQIGAICNTEKEFIDCINNKIKNNNLKKYNQYSEKVFKNKYSYRVSLKKFEEMIEEIKIK